MHLPALANLSSYMVSYNHSWVQHKAFVKSKTLYPYFGKKINRNRSQDKDKMLYVDITEICVVPSYDGTQLTISYCR